MAADHVIAKITADISDLKAELQKGNAEFRKFGEKLDKALPEDPFERIRKSAQNMISVAAVVAPFRAAGQAATEFESELRNLNTITEMSESALEKYGEGLRTLSLELGTTTGAAANARAAYDLASAGFVDAGDNAAILEATLKTATAGKVEAAEAAKLLAGTLNAYGESAQESQRYSDVFFQTVKLGVTTIPELAGSFGNVTSSAAQAGISVEELGAAVATTTARGIKTTTTVDGLRGAIMNLIAPSDQAKKEMARLGIEVNEQTLKQDGLLKTLQKLRDANGGSAESFKRLLGDVQAVSVALSLVGDGGDKFAQNLAEMQNAAGSTDAALSEVSKSFQHSMDQFKVALEAAGVAVGSVFLPAAKTGLDMVTSLTTAFATAPEPIRDLITAVATLGGTYLVATKGLTLLTSKKQLDTITTGLNSAAKVLNVTVTDANTKAAFANALAKTRMSLSNAVATASTLTLSGSLTAATTALKASAAATGMVGVAFAAVAGVVIAGALALHEYTKIVEEQTAANESLLDIELRMAKGQKNYAKMVKLTTEELREQKFAAEDLTEALLANLERQEAAKNAGNEALVERLRQENTDIRKKREELAKDEADDRKRKQQEASTLKPQQDDDAEKKAAKEAEDRRKEAVKEALHDIEVLKKSRQISADEEKRLLEEVLETQKTNADERRSIEEKIADIVGDKAKEADEAQKKRDKEAKDRAEKNAKEAKAAAERSYELQLQNLQIELQSAKTIEEKLRISKEIVDLEAQKARFSEQNANNDKKILENAKAEKARLEEEAAKAKEKRDSELEQKRGELERKRHEEGLAREQESFERRRQKLDMEASMGKDVSHERERLFKEELKAAEEAANKRLELAEKEIRAKEKAANQDATPEEKALNAQNAALEIERARREAAKEKQVIVDKSNESLIKQTQELQKQLELLREQNKEKGADTATLGGVSGIESLNDNTGQFGVSRRARKAKERELEEQIARNQGILNSRENRRKKTGEIVEEPEGGPTSTPPGTFGDPTEWATKTDGESNSPTDTGSGEAAQAAMQSGEISASLLIELAAQIVSAIDRLVVGGDKASSSYPAQTTPANGDPLPTKMTPFQYTTNRS